MPDRGEASAPLSEFGLIRKYFAPLSVGAAEAFSLGDDAALLPSKDYVVTKDLMVEGVHFRREDALSLVARKLVRVNLSDLAAKGARPIGYFLGCVWRRDHGEADIAEFAKGLAADQATFKIALFGGDTTRHRELKGPLTLSATFFGAPAKTGMIERRGAAVGDDLFVSGVIGDAGLGLSASRKTFKASEEDKAYLSDRYLLPLPRLAFGGAIAGLATAAIDVSDGLLQDAGHIAERSQARLEISADLIPVSAAADRWRRGQGDQHAATANLASMGDDYEILFTAPPARRRSIEIAAQVTKTPVTRIGRVVKGTGVAFVAPDGKPISIDVGGYDHFA